MTRIPALLVAFILAIPGASLASAQVNASQQAQLRMTVVDITGAGLPAAAVRVTPAGGTPTELATDDHGLLTLSALTPGPVSVHAEFPGFTPFDGTLTLRRGNNNQVITLAIAGVQEEVVVTDTVPVPDEKRFDNLRVLSIAPLLAEAIDAVFEDGSVSELFGGDNM